MPRIRDVAVSSSPGARSSFCTHVEFQWTYTPDARGFNDASIAATAQESPLCFLLSCDRSPRRVSPGTRLLRARDTRDEVDRSNGREHGHEAFTAASCRLLRNCTLPSRVAFYLHARAHWPAFSRVDSPLRTRAPWKLRFERAPASILLMPSCSFVT